MNAGYDDPKYTAYVLGELDDAARADVEAELRADPQLAATIAEIRAATDRLTQLLAAEHLPQLHAGQRAALWAAAGANGSANGTANGSANGKLNGELAAGASPSPRPSPFKGEGEAGDREAAEAAGVERVAKAETASRPRRLSWRGRLVGLAALAIAGCLILGIVLPATQKDLEVARQAPRNDSQNGLKQIGMALDNYEGKRLPTPYYLSDDIQSSPTSELGLKRSNTGGEFRFRSAANAEGDEMGVTPGYIVGKPVYETKDRKAVGYTVTKPTYAAPSPNGSWVAGKPTGRSNVTSLDAIQPTGSSSSNSGYRYGDHFYKENAAVKGPTSRVAGGVIVQEVEKENVLGGGRGTSENQVVRGKLLAGRESNDRQQNLPKNQPGQPKAAMPAQQGNQPQGQQQSGQKDEPLLAETVTAHDRRVNQSQDPQNGQQESKTELGTTVYPVGDLVIPITADPNDRLGTLRAIEKSQPGPPINGVAVGQQPADRYAISVGKGWDYRGPYRRQDWDVQGDHNTEAYDYVNDNQFLGASENPLSTFSIDVDTASYSNVRRFLMQQNQRPPRGAVRIEELVNYFRYDYPQPEGDKPFSVTTEVASCPWQPEHRLVRIGLKGREIAPDKRPMTNLVFLIDVSGSMNEPNKLPLVKQSLKMLAEQLGENDKVSMVVYAGSSGLVLPSTRGDHRQAILDAIDQLNAGGSTNGAQGIELAYEIATNNLQKGGVNRVILATDGDFNVGVTNQDELVRLIEEKAKTGVFLTTLGFGMGNIKDSTLEKLADKGNGNYAYIDDLPEARKVLVEQMGSTLVTIAKDVKIQVEFNPAAVAGYRLIGYENRILAKEDFNDDKKDAGEIGAGHTVTALYEVEVVKGEGGMGKGEGKESGVGSQEAGDRGQESESKLANGQSAAVDALKYQKPASLSDAAKSGELFTLKLRYKQPDGDKSTLIETPVKDAGKKYGEASADFKFAAAVAAFGMILRDSPFKGNATIAAVEELAGEGVVKQDDKQQSDASYRAEFVEMVKRAKALGAP